MIDGDTPMKNTPTEAGQALRRRAEEMFKANQPADPETLSPEETKQLLHELRVHQIELKMQNEELQRTQNELECSRARYFDLYDLAPVGYLTLSEKGLIQEANLAAAGMLGQARGTLVRQPISRIILNDDQDIYYLHRKKLLKSGEPQACELRMLKADGTAFWVHLAASAEQDPATSSGQAHAVNTGQCAGQCAEPPPVIRVVLSDISERKQAEVALHQAKEAAEIANRTKSQFLANMSHELRTPMTGVLGMLDLALVGNLEEEQREFIETAHTSARSLVRILNDILDLSKIEAGKLAIVNNPFSLHKCLENTTNIFIPVAKSKGLDFNLKVADNVPKTLVGDQTRLIQVLTNLASNAVKFTEKGKVELRVAAGDSAPGGAKRKVTFIFSDTGIGISADKKDLIFRIFSQVDESHSRNYGGAGLGLAISKEIVERMGGTIGFTSEEGQGSAFSCTIPFGEAEAECDVTFASRETTTAVEGPRPEMTTKPCLLVAEDDPTISQVLGTMLRMEKYEVAFAENGQKAVEMWENGNYDLILMDVQMPRMTGFEATAAIREKENTRGGHIPIVAMTAHAFKEDEKRCLDAGMDAYISKPINFRACLQLIEDNLKKASDTSVIT
jgi:PAS domain S-box-containing protein